MAILKLELQCKIKQLCYTLLYWTKGLYLPPSYFVNGYLTTLKLSNGTYIHCTVSKAETEYTREVWELANFLLGIQIFYHSVCQCLHMKTVHIFK